MQPTLDPVIQQLPSEHFVNVDCFFGKRHLWREFAVKCIQRIDKPDYKGRTDPRPDLAGKSPS